MTETSEDCVNKFIRILIVLLIVEWILITTNKY